MKKTLTLALLAISGDMLAQQDIYVYLSDLYTPVLQANSVQRIEFGETGVQFITTTGETQSASYDSFDYFRFYPTPTPTGVKIVAEKAAKESSIYSLTGVKQNPTGNIPAGVYIRIEKLDGQENVKKILKR